MYISHIYLFPGIYHDISLGTGIRISRYIPDHKLFDAKATLYIAHTSSLLMMGLNYEVLASFEGLLKPITSDKRKIQDLWKAFRVSI